MLEKSIEAAVVAYAKKKHGMLCRKMNGLGFRGWPDRFFITKKGNIFFIEFKRPGLGVLSPSQEVMILDLRERGVAVYVVNDIQTGKDIVDNEEEQAL
jgi:VRR-NUC domain